MSRFSKVRTCRRSGGELGRLARTLLGDERGQELVEMVLVLPILLLAVVSVLEIGHVFTITHGMASISREGANLAARGSTLAQAAQSSVVNGGDIQLNTLGGAIASRIQLQSGSPVVVEQASYGSVGASKMGVIGDAAAPLAGVVFDDGRVLYTVEIYRNYTPLTPLVGIGGAIIPSQLYEAAVF